MPQHSTRAEGTTECSDSIYLSKHCLCFWTIKDATANDLPTSNRSMVSQSTTSLSCYSNRSESTLVGSELPIYAQKSPAKIQSLRRHFFILQSALRVYSALCEVFDSDYTWWSLIFLVGVAWLILSTTLNLVFYSYGLGLTPPTLPGYTTVCCQT